MKEVARGSHLAALEGGLAFGDETLSLFAAGNILSRRSDSGLRKGHAVELPCRHTESNKQQDRTTKVDGTRDNHGHPGLR